MVERTPHSTCEMPTATHRPRRVPRRTVATGRIRQVAGTAGLAIALAGAGYAALMLAQWVGSGFTQLPLLMGNILAFTAIVLGLQTIFGAFFMSTLAAQCK